MKLAFISTARIPTKNAHGFQIINMCSAFAKQGEEVELIVPRRINSINEDPFDFYSIPRNFKIKKLLVLDIYPIRFIPERLSNFLYTWTFLFSAKAYLFFNKVDVVYTREPKSRFLFGRTVLEVHMPEHVVFSRLKPEKLVVLNSYIKNKLVDSGWREDKVFVSPDAVDLTKIKLLEKNEARKRLGVSIDVHMVVYWGNFKAWKGVDTLVSAARIIPEVKVMMVGGTKYSDIERVRIESADLDNVKILGFQNQSEQSLYLSSADALILPNTAKDENSRLYTSPLKLFEYMAYKKPIVASDLPSLREILNEENAFFFTPDDPQNLAEVIRSVLINKEEACRKAKQASVDVENYTWDKRARSIISFISQ